MNALITITHRTVEHTDPEAAGFTDGYWWTLTDELGTFESAAATAEEAEEIARAAAAGHGHFEDTITLVREKKLLKRKADEARFEKLLASA